MVLQSLKELYLHLEDRYYALIERISEKVPVNKVTDAIDKIMPSFLLLIILVLVLLAYFIVVFLPATVLVRDAEINVLIQGKNRYGEISPLRGVTVEIEHEGSITSFDTNADGKLSIPYTAKIGETLYFKILRQGYKPNPFERTIEIERDKMTITATLTELILTEDISFRFLDSDDNPISNSRMYLSFECSDQRARAPERMETYTDVSGKVEVYDVEIDCLPLILFAETQGYEAVSGQSIRDGSIINLRQKKQMQPPESKGHIIANIKFNGEPVKETITVDLFKDSGATPVYMESKHSSEGQVSFEVLPGIYKIKTKANPKFKSSESGFITVGANDHRTIRLDVEEVIVGRIRVQAVDKNNQEPIEGARVSLMKNSSQEAFKDSDENGMVEFNLTVDREYELVVDHPDYCIGRMQTVRKSEAIIKMEIERYTGDCGGVLIAKVVDEKNKPIPNARVAIFDEEKNSLGWKERITDINGEAEFKGLYADTYTFFAYKGFGSGWSDVKEFRPREDVKEKAVIVLNIPKANLKARVVDRDGEPLPFSDVTLKNAANDRVIIGPRIVEDLNGTIEFEVDSGLPVYLLVRKEGFANHLTERFSLHPNESRFLEIELQPERISGEIEAEFLGLFREGKVASEIAPGREYTAKFIVSVPEHADYDRFGLHIRTGRYNVMEKDFIYIKDVFAPGLPRTIKGTSFNPQDGVGHDMQFATAGDAKWVNMEWDEGKGFISVHATIAVKAEAIAEELPLHWRAWGLREGKVFRDPADLTLGEALTEKEFYARAYERHYNVGMEQLCTDKWCTVLRILDVEENVARYVDRQYSAHVGSEYKLFFSILNNSLSETDIYSRLQLKIFNDEGNIRLGEYEVIGDTVVRGNADASETNYIDVGAMPPNKDVRGEIEFVPELAKTGSITLRLHAPERYAHVFEETILINVQAANNFIVEFKVGEEFLEEAPVLGSGIENNLTIRVRDQETELEVSSATVKVRNKAGDILSQRVTGSMGVTEITLPSMMPNETVFIAVEKPGYAEKVKEVRTEERVISIEPETIGIQLNVHEKHSDSVILRILNRTQMRLTLDSLELAGEFKGIIYNPKVHALLSSEYFGREIEPEGKLDISMRVLLSDLGKMVRERQSLEGSLIASVSAHGQSWVEKSKVNISVGLGGEVDNPECLIIDKREWRTHTKANEVRTDFTVSNTCTINGRPVKLSNLSARVEWESNRLGDYYAEIGNTSTELRDMYSKVLAGTVREEERLPAILSFTPHGGILGTAKADIIITAEHLTEDGKQILQGRIGTEIEIISLEECIRFDRDLIRIEDWEEQSFSIETSDCKIPTNFMLDTKLRLSEKEFTLQSDDSKEITIMPSEEIPGQYPIYVRIKSPGEPEYAFRKLIRVIIEPDGCLRLNRYEFDIYGDLNDGEGFDVGVLINDCYQRQEDINISYDERNIWEAMKTGALWGVGGFVYGGVRAMASGKDFFGRPLPRTVCQEAGFEYCTGRMVCENEDITMIGNVVCCRSRCVTEGVSAQTDICSKRGYSYCGPEMCDGRERIIEGITCCSGRCKITELSPEAKCQTQKAYYCSPFESCPTTKRFNVGGYECCPKQCITSAIAADQTELISPRAPVGFLSLEGVVKGAFDGIGALLNIDDPWTGAVVGFIAGTAFKYFQQETGEFQVPVAVADFVVDSIRLFSQRGLEEVEETLISVERRDSRFERSRDQPYGFEKIDLVFINKGIEQEDPYKPVYRLLGVDGKILEYQTRYEIKSKEEAEQMREMKPVIVGSEGYEEKFHLQFNAYKPKPKDPVIIPDATCKINGLVGSTGKNAIPNIKLAWNWRDIEMNECDEGGNETYCDATQFSISLLKKINRIEELLAGQRINCPSAEGILSEKTQDLEQYERDVGVTRIKIEKDGRNATVIGTIESNQNPEMQVFVEIFLQKEGRKIECPAFPQQTIQVVSKEDAKCTFTELEEGLYTAHVVARPNLDDCTDCYNANPGNNRLDTKFLVGDTGDFFLQCEPYSTARLDEFIAANPGNEALKEALELTNFKAHLIMDGYTMGFRNDFHSFSITKDFFNTPAWYKGETGLGKYFSNNELLEFTSPFLRPEFGHLPAGKYNVRINIVYDNECWCLFEGTEPNARIEIELERLETPEPDSVFYYMPFNGLIGTETGRHGYGVNFRQESEQTIPINEDTRQHIRTSTIAGSVPVPGGWINARLVDDFKTLNNDARGVVLDIERSADGTRIIYSPSVATPIILRVSGGEQRNAYAFYQLSIERELQRGSSYLATWSGIGKGCRDFSDAEITTAFMNSRDIRGGVGRVECAGGFDTHHYGVEWCNVHRSGEVFLKSALFTPQNKNSILEIVDASDSAAFITPQEWAVDRVMLTGAPGLNISSVEKILQLVEDEQVCVAGVGNNVKATFFWNIPEMVDSAMTNVVDAVPVQCIQAG